MGTQGKNLPKTRLEAFSDGVLAIAITLLALEIRLPEAGTALAVFALIPLYFAVTTRLAPGGRPSHGDLS